MPSNLMSPLLWQSVPFGDQDAWLDFLGIHALWHRALAQATGTPALTLDDLRTQLLRHGELHDAEDAALKIPTAYDLISYDLRDKDSFEGFMQVHALEHHRQRQTAGL